MRFYPGSSWNTWYFQTPIHMVRAALRMMPRLQAEEAMREQQVLAMGSGLLEKHEATRIWRGWQRQAQGDRPRRTGPRARLTPQKAAQIGIKVVTVPRTKTSDGG